MARHGWIGPDSYQTQRDRLTEADGLALQYPLGSLLCTRQIDARPTLVVAFDTLTPAQQRRAAQLPGLNPLADHAFGHPDVDRGAFELVYSLPDIYYSHIQRDQVSPAYQSTMQDYGHQVRFWHTRGWQPDWTPPSIRDELSQWTSTAATGQSLNVIFASHSDFNATLNTIRTAIRSQQRVLVTALTPAQDLTAEQRELPTIWQEFVVPMWAANLSALNRSSAGDSVAQVVDIMPTALAGFISCAEGYRSFAVGRDLNTASQLPRVHSVHGRFYIFEADQTTILERNGDMAVYSRNGELRPGAAPPTPVLINSLQELQRFGRAR